MASEIATCYHCQLSIVEKKSVEEWRIGTHATVAAVLCTYVLLLNERENFTGTSSHLLRLL
jgi:hypothetical protein